MATFKAIVDDLIAGSIGQSQAIGAARATAYGYAGSTPIRGEANQYVADLEAFLHSTNLPIATQWGALPRAVYATKADGLTALSADFATAYPLLA